MKAAGAVLILALGAAGCARGPDTVEEVRTRFDLPPPTPQKFVVCHEHGCRERTTVGLTATAWGQVRDIFSPPPADAATERARIALAVGRLEALVAPQAGTEGDVAGTFAGLGRGHGQLDCEDEAANTMQYLIMMRDDGLLRWHVPVGRAWRGSFVDGWPHTTAVLAETGSGRKWVVDSWFEDNGRPAHVVSLETWSAGWHPGAGAPPR